MRSRLARIAGTFLVAAGLGLVSAAVVVAPAGAAEAPVGLGTASSFAVLAGTTVTNTGSSVITGNVGVSPGTAITGFPPGTVNGTFHRNDAAAIQAQSDVTIAYNDAAGRAPTQSGMTNLTGLTLVSGVYSGAAGLSLNGSGVLTLNGQGNPNAVFIFQAGSTFISGSSSVVRLINSAQACNVYWKVGSSATLGTNSVLVGTVLALTSVTANTGASVDGRLLARNGAGTLDTNTISPSTCAAQVPPSSTTTTTTAAVTTTTTAAGTATTTVPTATTVPVGTAAPVTTITDTARATGGGGSPSGPGTTGGATPVLPATGTRPTGLAASGLLAIALGALVLFSSRRARASV